MLILMNLFFVAIIPEKSDWLSGKPERFPCFVRARPDEKINLLLQKMKTRPDGKNYRQT